MTLGEAIVLTAAAEPTLTALIGDRMFPVEPPTGATLPNVVYQRITSTPAETHGEAAEVGLDLVQFTIAARTYEECEAVADALKTAFDNKDVGGRGRGALQDERDIGKPAPDLFSTSLDFLI